MVKRVMIRTGRISYQEQSGETVLDITAKSGKGLGAFFAPPWKLVMASKRGEITWEEYTERYRALLWERYRDNPQIFRTLLNTKNPVLCCYCKDTHTTTRHCHRYLLLDFVKSIASEFGWVVADGGEVEPVPPPVDDTPKDTPWF